jgi:YhcH/YjgK/YiaL family protein
MILDVLAQHRRYLSLHLRFPAAFAWLAAADWTAIADGRHPIQGDDLFAIVESGPSKDPATRRFESHRAYLDIQVNLAGGERMGWCPAAGLPVVEDFRPDNDIRFHAPPAEAAQVLVRPGWFAIFWPEDAHMPFLHPDGGQVAVRKAVLKVRLA